ncbi:hypothetical protein L207DRAFT_272776 [Hyaloscypha variabilis F]|uniref:Fork-head domain-containing protein n=1 Tax=Hyaloscypha variabilis (strain UAMH 11265 / GT02V1 / F) TaxID=1149755 RepID=A0A2J6S054_HYAVF|nr:hypothetical protein L207DRAFT_272776 [Hyaloscypha variabilis F]
MTSPQQDNGDVVAALATTSMEDNLRTTDFTAAEPHAESAPSELEPEQPTDPDAQHNVEQDIAIKQSSPNEQQPDVSVEPEVGTAGAMPDMGSNFLGNYPHDLTGALPPPELVEPFAGGLDILAGLTTNANPYPPFYDPFNASFPPMIDGLPAMPDMDALVLAQNQHMAYLDHPPNIQEPQETRISAFAKLEFQDGHFYVTTYAIILGRDVRAHHAAVRHEEEMKRVKEDQEGPPRTPARRNLESLHAKSIVSESGGILRDGNDSDDERDLERRRLKKASKASKRSRSSASSSHHQSRRNSEAQPAGEPVLYQAQPQVRRSAPGHADAVPLDPESFRPSPLECPIIGIHPSADRPASDYKSISRKHAKIKFNQKRHVWELQILGRNGGFVNGFFHPCESVIPLNSGDKLQFGVVGLDFVLPDIAIAEMGGEDRYQSEELEDEPYQRGGKQMSYEFEEAHGNGNLHDTSEEESEAGREDQDLEHEGEEDDEEEGSGDQENGDEDDVEADGEENADEQVGEGLDEQEDVQPALEPQPPPDSKPQKKRGVGRPPKDGIMSTRQRKEAKKAAELAAQTQSQPKSAKKNVPPAPGAPAPVKNKVGRPRKHPRPDTPPQPREKRKYTKRKPKEPKDGEAKQEGSEDQAKEKKDKKPPKPPRSPSPVFREEDLTPEQLAKPNANYVTLIHDALSNSATGQMSLPQIYRAIQRKYPYFVLKCGTNGWQSSVRHNLSQHHAFKKVERDGKGWMWAIVEGISIEKEKKRRPTPPPPHASGQMQQIYPQMMQGYPYGPGMMGPPPGYPPMQPHHLQPGQPAHMGPQMHMNGHMPPPGLHPHLNGIPQPGFPPAIPAQLAAPNNPQSYSSPYAPKPVPPSEPQRSDQHAPIDQTPHSQAQPAIVTPESAPQPLSAPQSRQPQQAEQAQQPPAQLQQQSATPATQLLQLSPPLQPPQSQQQQQPSVSRPPSPPRHNDVVMRAVNTFKTTLLSQMRQSNQPNAQAILDSAVNRVLGLATESTVGDDPHEGLLMSTLRGILSSIAGSDFPRTAGPSNDHRSPQPPSEASDSASQPPAKATGERPTVARPSFTGQSQGRPNGPSVPRPPMATPGMVRTNSGGSAHAPSRPSASSASPAPASAATQGPNGASTPKQSPKEPVQLAGQKRPLDDADDMREFKKLSTSGPPQLKT